MPGAIQLLRRGKARRTAADYRNLFSGAKRWRLRLDPTFIPRMIHNGALNSFDGHRRLVDAQNTRRLARSGTDASGELWEIVGGVQLPERIAPAVLIYEIVPIRDDVRQRATGVAKGNAAIHATAALQAHLLFVERLVHLKVIVHTFSHWTPRRRLALKFHEPRYLTHEPPAFPLPYLRLPQPT